MERTSRDILSELTVANLKEIARRVGQSTNGTKADIVARILSEMLGEVHLSVLQVEA